MTKAAPALRTPEAPPRASRAWSALGAGAGPAAIVASVLLALRGFAFENLLTNQHPDLLAFVLPRLSFLGRSLAAGHVPLWNPFDMTGAPYAADPQSGWLYVPAMALFSALSPAAAMRAFVVWNPMLAGLGAFWFLRKEGLGRPAATAGGLSLAMMMASSIVAVSLPFAGAIAWTTIVLVAVSAYTRTGRWSGRLGWLALGAFAWGQVASAHMSHGLGACTALLVAYLAAAGAREVRAGRTTARRAALLGLLFLAVLPLANLAIFVPRLALVARSSLRQGYDALGAPLARAVGVDERPIMSNGVWTGWPLSIGSTPGAYAGASILLALPAAFRSRRHRSLAVALGAVAALAYVATWSVLIEAAWFRNLVLRMPYGDVYLHNPGRLRYLWLMVVPLLGAIGIQGFIDRPLTWRSALRWIGAGAAIFLLLPLVLGAHPVRLSVLAAGVAVSAPLLAAVGSRRSWVGTAVASVLAIELAAAALYVHAYEGGVVFYGLERGAQPNLVPQPLRWPNIPADRFLEPGPIARFLVAGRDRYLSWVPPDASFEKAYLFRQGPPTWPALVNERGTLFGAHDSLGYNPLQPPRYWSYIRAIDPQPVFYNASVVNEPTLEHMRLLGARYLVVPRGVAPPVPGHPVESEAGFILYEVEGWESRASLVAEWTVVDRAVDALREVVEPGFDPALEAVVEADPGIEPAPGMASGTAAYRELAPEDVRIGVEASAPSLLVVRNNWDEGWSATVGGRPAPVLRADYFRMAVAVPAGRHEVRLAYRDPWIARGLWASAVVWFILVAALLAARRREHAVVRVP